MKRYDPLFSILMIIYRLATCKEHTTTKDHQLDAASQRRGRMTGNDASFGLVYIFSLSFLFFFGFYICIGLSSTTNDELRHHDDAASRRRQRMTFGERELDNTNPRPGGARDDSAQ
jgi:hypothetical protein